HPVGTRRGGDRRRRQQPSLLALRLVPEYPQVEQQVLVGQRHPQVLGLDRAADRLDHWPPAGSSPPGPWAPALGSSPRRIRSRRSRVSGSSRSSSRRDMSERDLRSWISRLRRLITASTCAFSSSAEIVFTPLPSARPRCMESEVAIVTSSPGFAR